MNPTSPHTRRSSPVRRAATALLAVGLVVLLGACVEEDRTIVATVNGTEIDGEAFDAAMSAFAANDAFVESDAATQSFVKDGVATPRLRAAWLQIMLQNELVEREFRDRKLKLASKADGDAAAEQFFGNPEVFAGFPKPFRDDLVATMRRQAALDAALHGNFEVTDELVNAIVARETADQPDGQEVDTDALAQELRPQIEEVATQNPTSLFAIVAALDADITVDKRYGVWKGDIAVVEEAEPADAARVGLDGERDPDPGVLHVRDGRNPESSTPGSFTPGSSIPEP